ncbi:T9SS type A sorting domain-containing protein [Gillisia marina]|uniref:T9SS type A sorting domain-containing protein n=1 Tax=Gillisia marina TaxID=1167637 RepID=UPI00029B2546|nr:T9SS type A sorting domain-containing protein [Gillisia marina]
MIKKLHFKVLATATLSLFGILVMSAQSSTATPDHTHTIIGNSHTHATALGIESQIDNTFSWHTEPPLEGEREKIEVQMAPNPTSQSLNLRMAKSHISSVAIYNLEGKKLLRMAYDAPGHSSTIDVATLKKGLMIVQIETEKGKTHTRRFFKK